MSAAFLSSVLGACLATAQLDYSKPYSFTTLAGVGSVGSADGTGSTARFNGASAVAVDPAGNVYVADQLNLTVRKITAAGTVTTLAGRAGVAGSTNGPAATARFGLPEGVAVDPAGNVYVADAGNYTIRKITPAGEVSTFAGQTGIAGKQDGTGTAATFKHPAGLAVDGGGNIVVKDLGNGIRKITPAGLVSTLLNFPHSFEIAPDRNGNVYFGDEISLTLQRVDAGGQNTFVAGSTPGSTDGTGSSARFLGFKALTVDRDGNLIAFDGSQLRKITPAGVVTTLTLSGFPSNQRPYPVSLAADGSGNLYFAGSNAVSKITPALAVSVVAGMPLTTDVVDGTGSGARLGTIEDLAIGPNGDLYLASPDVTIRKVTRDGVVTKVAGNSRVGHDADGPVETATFSILNGIAVDSSGNIYVTTQGSAGVRKISGGLVSTLAGNGVPINSPEGLTARLVHPEGIVADAAGNLYVADGGNRICKITPAGVVTTLTENGRSAVSFYIRRLAIDASGNLYGAGNGVIYRITPAGVVTIAAGVPPPPFTIDQSPRNDGAAASAHFRMIRGIAVDATGNLYAGDDTLVRKISAGGIVSTLGGLENLDGNDDGTGADARFMDISGLAVDGAGGLYVGSLTTVRRGVAAGIPIITSQPQSLTVGAGSSAQFSVAATGSPAPTYQWFFNGSMFNGATTSTLSFSNARTADAGDYTVTVTNPLGSVTSAKATLTVNAATPPPATGGSGGSTGGSSGGGGGGAPSLWFVLVLAALGWHCIRTQPRGAR